MAGSASASQQAFADLALDPQPGFSFAEANNTVLRGMHDSDAAAPKVFSHGVQPNSAFRSTAARSSPFASGTGGFISDMEFVDPVRISAGMAVDDLTKANVPISLPTTIQTSIAKVRSKSVAEQYGRLTPPGSTSPPKGGRKSSASSTRSGQAIKLDRSERARHAANQRHARCKHSCHIQEERAGSRSSESVDEDEDVDNKKEKYREKNRIAAARCRAKKKDNTDGLEERHRELQASHNFLKREDRRLRDELSTLRILALQHSPDTTGCACAVLHNYNRYKASEVARRFSGPMVASPSDSVLSGAQFWGMSQTSSLSAVSMPELFGRPQLYSAGSNYAPVSVTVARDVRLDHGMWKHGFAAGILKLLPGLRGA
ncbi:hypothetical protein LTR56_026987 [Elasticomyces elasticus]|nr:hypothetical protein LTR56_026987 [Elasticomyces elasticus]KAK5722294.1 hypothetical protein LTS12_027565 [Elasticomyces elasticus]